METTPVTVKVWGEEIWPWIHTIENIKFRFAFSFLFISQGGLQKCFFNSQKGDLSYTKVEDSCDEMLNTR